MIEVNIYSEDGKLRAKAIITSQARVHVIFGALTPKEIRKLETLSLTSL